MGINNRSSVDPRWQFHSERTLSGFDDATIQIIDPNTAETAETFNWYTNATGGKPRVLWTGDGQLSVSRQTLNALMPVGSVTQIRSITFQVPMDGPLMPIRKGLQIRVIRCEGDPQAEHYQYTVTSGFGGGLAFRRTIEAEADMGVII